MLEKIKEIGTQVATTASDAAKGITTSVKSGAESIANATVSATEAINEKAVRASTAQMCSILETAIAELQTRPLLNRPVSLTTSVNFGLATLEMQVHLSPEPTLPTSPASPVSTASPASQAGSVTTPSAD